MGSFVQLTSLDGTASPAWVARPDVPARGAVVVLQEIFGVNAHIRAVADRLAARGYMAVAPSLFTRVEAGVDLGYGDADRAKGMALKSAAEALPPPGVLPEIEAAIAHAATLVPGGKVGIVGFCWGGLWAWRAACNLPSLSAAACYYGGGMTTPLEMGREPLCPVIAHFGRRDAHIPVDAVQAFAQAQKHVQVHLYDADHGFNCDQRSAYDEASALQARDRTLAFFDQHLA
ncbi:MAG: dienelactone hydrolase family protein [Delftia acidovorans]|jgi:carboxymethylenebutenolidase|uniref:dienelactone hydrolase family protein n=1 Tax=Delftia acidovorans TaxID=80866 RepID=UPI002820B438|nr:dienelactone hydrolase family protein [Delftia acidovorans]MDR3015309.1 dienelactone hydrolase family protein [Delftia acidovorans]